MRYSINLVLMLMCVQMSYSQIYEVGIFAGGSNLISDVGATNYINPNQVAFGGIVKWNRSARHAWRLSLIYSELEALDSKSDDPRRIERNLTYNNNSFVEISAGMEFTFIEFDMHNGGTISTPYLYSGVSVAYHDNYYFSNGNQISEGQSSWAFGIPMVLGFKITVTDHIVLGVEVGARYTFSDELDGSFPASEELRDFAFGNLNNNDWYTFTGLTLTYTFGRNPCYCNF
ncbi:MAG: hypothetical protein KJO49_05955 [Bacteroidia bacterium]|nr:hypothetical protein [Bacteroidia bacterium]MBT8268725.1 hypothetical protein [Bacteroidia bacterium]NNF81561.1 hypothetical protein [Flavobacteriaceae bacterium]NNK69723.1 hypothetical protein [Flavobacteriaceae bacterium]NNL81268.1 hypothetical protein [Flavobacteriaceae bacterium]